MDRSLARLYESDVEQIVKKPSLIQMLDGSSKGKRDLAKALKKTIVAAGTKKTPVINGLKGISQTSNGMSPRTALEKEGMASNINDLSKSTEEKGHTLMIDRRKQGRDGLILRTPVHKRANNKCVDERNTVVDHNKLRSMNIDLLPSRMYSIIVNGRNRFDGKERCRKNFPIQQSNSVSTNDADDTAIQRSETDVNRGSSGDDVWLIASVNDKESQCTSAQTIDRRKTPRAGEAENEKNNIGEEHVPQKGSTVMAEHRYAEKRLSMSEGGTSTRADRSRLLHSLKHLLRGDSDSFSPLQTQLRRRNATAIKILYQNVNINDMTSPAEVENELNKLAVNLAKLSKEVWDIKSGVEAALKKTKNTINADD